LQIKEAQQIYKYLFIPIEEILNRFVSEFKLREHHEN